MSFSSAGSPITATSLSVYFQQRLAECAQALDPPPQEDTCWYLSLMLERFGSSADLFSWQDGVFDLRPLALLYGDAVEARSARERCLLLQQLGDMSLFLGALFPQRFSRRGIGQDYVIGMGGGAYDYLADNARSGRHVFAELASAFEDMLALVASACHEGRDYDDADIVGLYQRWVQQRDFGARRALLGLGIDLSADESMQ